jgi:DNA-binding beta-propeller fold protein YncE
VPKHISQFARSLAVLAGLLLGVAIVANAQGTLVQTIDLSTWTGSPVTIVQPPPPQPAPGFSLTSLAFNRSTHTLYVADYATTNVYAIDTTTGAVTSAVYTNGLFSTADIGATQNLPGTAPKVVLANPVTIAGSSWGRAAARSSAAPRWPSR